MTDRLFMRRVRVQVGPIVVNYDSDDSLKITFKVQKNPWSKEPNTAHLEIYNMSANRRGIIDALIPTSKKIPVPVIIEAGYAGSLTPGVGVIFRGHLRSVAHSHETADVRTKIIAGSYASADVPINATFDGPNLSIGTIAVKMLKQIQSRVAGVDVTGAITSALTGDVSKLQERYNNAVTVQDNALDALNRLTFDFGYQFTEQDGKIMVLKNGKDLLGRSIVLNAGSGLVGAIDPITDTKRPEITLIRAKSLLRHDIEIGTAVQLDSKFTKGLFVVEHLEHTGDVTGGADAFITTFTGRAMGSPRSIVPAGGTDIAVTTGSIA